MDKEFLHKVAGLVQEKLGDGYEVEADEAVFDSGELHPYVKIRPIGDGYALTAVLNERARSVERLASAIVDAFLNNQKCVKESGIAEVLKSKENVLGSVKPALVNYEKNHAMLAGVPHLRFLDLAITYRIFIENDDGLSSALLTTDLMDYLGITTDELDEAAARSLEAEEIDYADSITDAFCNVYGTDLDNLPTIVTNKSHLYGAAMMLNPRVMENVAEKYGDHFLVIPSSVHEFLVFPYGGDLGYLSEMVRSINSDRSVISTHEVLSDNIYEYLQGNLMIADPR